MSASAKRSMSPMWITLVRAPGCASSSGLDAHRSSDPARVRQVWKVETQVGNLDCLWEDEHDQVWQPENIHGSLRQDTRSQTYSSATLQFALASTLRQQVQGHHLPVQSPERFGQFPRIAETNSSRLPAFVDGMPMTTLMLRNLPPGLTQQQLLQCLPPPDQAHYNALHVPINAWHRNSSGYAFLNFETCADAFAFDAQWNGRYMQFPAKSSSRKSRVVKIGAASCQGFVANLLQWQKSARGLVNAAVLPIVYVDGRLQDFWNYVGSQSFLNAVRASQTSSATSASFGL